MARFYFRCDTCGYYLAIEHLPRVYVFDDGRRLWMEQRYFWCRQCDSVSIAEALDEDPRSSAQRHHLLEAYHRELQQETVDESNRNRILTLIADAQSQERNRTEWKALRKSPQRCLRCGNVDISVPELLGTDLPHPTCGGTLTCTATVMGGTWVAPEPHKYNVEGELIELGRCTPRHSLELWGDGH